MEPVLHVVGPDFWQLGDLMTGRGRVIAGQPTNATPAAGGAAPEERGPAFGRYQLADMPVVAGLLAETPAGGPQGRQTLDADGVAGIPGTLHLSL